jgi:polyketide biosynthesis enoyl-CoA hydratase PksI
MSRVVRVADLEAGIAELTLDDAEHDNRLSDRLCDELLLALGELAGRPALKVVLLRGRPDVFCAGATRQALQRVLSGTLHVKDLLLSRPMLDFPVPIVGALEGHAVGGGLVLALCCDLLVAARDKRYGMNFTSMGFTPAMGTTTLLPAAVGRGVAAEMTLTARYYRGRDLAGTGLFNRVVPAGEVLDTALGLARRIAQQPRHALVWCKESLALPRRRLLREAMSHEHLMHRVCFGRPETAAIIADTYLG